jgi:calcineurin-like phosphoesterase family protein
MLEIENLDSVLFSSDFHLGHRNIISYCSRPFDTVEEMNKALVDNFNAKSSPQTDVFFLGDFSLSGAAVFEFLPQLVFRNFIWLGGNHDKFFKRSKREKIQKEIQSIYGEEGSVFCKVMFYEQVIAKLGDVIVKMCHFPYAPPVLEGIDPHELRFLEHRPKPSIEDVLLCGHGHRPPERNIWTEHGRLCIDVGIDGSGNMSPYTGAEVYKLIQENLQWR